MKAVMKNILLKILFLLTCSIVNAQEKILDDALISISYRYEYVSNLLSPQPKEAVMTLLIGRQWSLFYNRHNDEFYFSKDDADSRKYAVLTIDENGNMKRTRPADYSGTIGPTEYTYLDRSKMEEIFVGRVLFRGFYTYSEKYLFPQWSVNQDEKTIMGYHCQKATTNYLGRKWIAWFTTELPFNSGPWKLTGLPGLILEAEDEEGHFAFIAVSAGKPAPEERLQIILKDELSLTKTTKEAFLRMQKNVYESDGDFGPVKIKTSSPRIKRKLNTIER
jgi:GLPGLI family protein